jgi:hypothetical protein
MIVEWFRFRRFVLFGVGFGLMVKWAMLLVQLMILITLACSPVVLMTCCAVKWCHGWSVVTMMMMMMRKESPALLISRARHDPIQRHTIEQSSIPS